MRILKISHSGNYFVFYLDLTRRFVANINIEIKRLIIPAIKIDNPIILKIKSINGIK